ncbi:MAG: DNA replication/repair protein RecF [Acidimicrobiia bacterium]
MRVRRLWLRDFRCYREAELAFPDGLLVIEGANGQGKTSLLEAVAWGATARSLRGVPDAALVRTGAPTAIVRMEVEDGAGRPQLLEAELHAVGRNRIRVNGKALPRTRDLVGFLRVTVFAPDDLELIKGGPATRRLFLDDLLEAMAPRYVAICSDYERVVRQRNAALRTGDIDSTTLAVFDDQLVAHGAALLRGRLRLTDRLLPAIAGAYSNLAGAAAKVGEAYEAPWAASPPEADGDLEGLLRDALGRLRRQEHDRRVTLVGPHRDDWKLLLDGLEARVQASQGEQRCLALALRLGGHTLVTEIINDKPVLLLDDVFSELDPTRSAALVANLPNGQTLLTTAGSAPVTPEQVIRVVDGRIDA